MPEADLNQGAAGEPGLMERVKLGDVGAFELLVERHWLATLSYVCHLCEDRQRAYELTQDAFSRLWRKREDWTGSGSVRVWLLRTARNMVISDRRKWKVRALGALKLAQEQKVVRTPLEDVEALELRAAIQRAVWKLSARRREAFVLFHLQGLSYREVSGIMGVRPQTVANYLQAAIAELRILLSDHMPQHLTEEDLDEVDE
jgi:RNA polymerase sigma-70 factor (ECF subfamily)